MEKSFKEKMLEAKEGNQIDQIIICNNGEVIKREKRFSSLYKNYNTKESARIISNALYNATESYSRQYAFDNIDLELVVGLVYNNLNNKEPLDNIVYYYTGNSNCYLGQEKTNIYNCGNGIGRQGYFNYDELIKLIENEGIIFNGPKSFDDFKESILSKKKININVSFDFREIEDNKKLIRK